MEIILGGIALLILLFKIKDEVGSIDRATILAALILSVICISATIRGIDERINQNDLYSISLKVVPVENVVYGLKIGNENEVHFSGKTDRERIARNNNEFGQKGNLYNLPY